MKAPSFWNRRSILTVLLYPVSRVYQKIVQSRLRKKPRYESRLPVICIGNAVMGGSGKTPVVHAVVELLKEMGKMPAILLRGYGGSAGTPLWAEKDSPVTLVGDEALLHARYAPTLVSADRIAGARLIEKNVDVDCMVMDDGLQNPSLRKTASFLVVDGENPYGNGLVFPAGPLRETIDDAVRRVQAMIILGSDTTHLATRYGFGCPVFQAQLQAVNGGDFAGKPVIAFAGIGRPEKFFSTLRAADAVMAETCTFPDHHVFTSKDIRTLIDKAGSIGGLLVTTRKDWVRLPVDIQSRVQVLDVALVWQDRAAVKNFLECLI
jgi:tetraacyldisaccharide 4'-kinase